MVKIKKFTAEFLMAVVIFFFLIDVTPSYLQWSRSEILPDEFFSVKQIYVSDYDFGKVPIFTYDRIVRKPFNAVRTVKVQRIDNGVLRTVFTTVDKANYDPKDPPEPVTTIEWFVGSSFSLPRGTYRIDVVWKINAQNYPETEAYAASNLFTVK